MVAKRSLAMLSTAPQRAVGLIVYVAMRAHRLTLLFHAGLYARNNDNLGLGDPLAIWMRYDGKKPTRKTVGRPSIGSSNNGIYDPR
jgi:hypothetical protein